MPSRPLRNASAIARGTSASASTSFARFSSILAIFSCSCDTAIARRPSAWRAGHAGIGLGLIGLQPGADVVADVDIGDIDRHDFERRLRIELAGQHRLGNPVRVFEHDLVRFGRADRADDPFADAGDDRFLGGPADELIEVGPHGDAGLAL